MRILQRIFLIFMLFEMSSCSGRADLAATGSEDSASSSHVGCLSIVHGHSPTNGALENYLYLVIICQGAKQSDIRGFTSGVNGDPMSKAELDYAWETTTGSSISVPIFWKIGSEDILIGNNTFNRKNGNVFTIVRQPNGKLEAQQCGTLGLHADSKDAVQFIRRQCSANKLVGAVKFYGVDE